jgi:hypothetical protein
MADDTYRVSLLGTGGAVIMDLEANALDGEYLGALPSGNGAAGGDFRVQFTISTPVVLGPTLDSIQALIFTPSCATSNCHDSNAAALLDLSDADTSFAQLVGVPTTQQGGAGTRVIPMDPGNSYLIQKLENAAGIDFARMPLGRPPLAQADINVIRQWILDGALRQ